MNDLVRFVLTAIIFFVLAPGVLFSLPGEKSVSGKNENRYVAGVVHALIFAVVMWLLAKFMPAL